MLAKLTFKCGGWAALAVLLLLLLFADSTFGVPSSFTGAVVKELVDALFGSQPQSDSCLLLLASLAFFLGLRAAASFDSAGISDLWPGRSGPWDGIKHPALWLVAGLGVSAATYARHYAPSLHALIFLGGAVLGQLIAASVRWNAANRHSAADTRFWSLTVLTLVFILAAASFRAEPDVSIFHYQGRLRWCGPWANPNIFGLLMGTGIVLATGLVFLNPETKIPWEEPVDRRSAWRTAAVTAGIIAGIFLVVAFTVSMGWGLLNSYSRGAWLGLLAGLGYLVGMRLAQDGFFGGRKMSGREAWFWKNSGPLALLLVSLLTLGFWQFQKTESGPVHRLFSAVNQADFSARNRLAAWVGTLEITADNPWIGAGWNDTEALYFHFYMPPKLDDGAAIRMNDQLLLAATLGIPAWFCLANYLWLTLTRKADWRGAICRAGAIALGVGFWFDGGLFILPTAATFWILVELGGAGGKTAAAAS